MDTIFMNNGAPRFVVKENQVTILYNLTMQLFKNDDNTHVMDVDLNNVEIQFKMNFDPKDYQTVTFDWDHVTVGSAEARPIGSMVDFEKDD